MVSPAFMADASSERPPSTAGDKLSNLPILRWNGERPTELITLVEARIAAGSTFAVLAGAPPLGRRRDRLLLERWWLATRGRLGGYCVGWAVLILGSDVDPTLLLQARHWPEMTEFPVRACADRAEAFWWLRTKLAEQGCPSATPLIAVARDDCSASARRGASTFRVLPAIGLARRI